MNHSTTPAPLNIEALKGRGALSNPDSRFTLIHSEREQTWDDIDSDSPPRIITEVREEVAKSVITKNQSPDVPFNQSINPYQGCEHGCIYCFARPTHAYWDLSPGLDFETKLAYKSNAAELLDKALSSPRYKCQPIVLGTNTDPYQPIEREKRVTRDILEVLKKYNHPFSIITKSSLILRDLELLQEMAQHRLCSVRVSVTTLDNELKRKLEPRTASAEARLKVIRTLHGAGIPVGVLVAPVIPKINDHELENILHASAKAGANTAAYIFIRLPHEVKVLFKQWLETHYPRRAEHVMSLIQQSREGKTYDAKFGQRMVGTGHFADIIQQRFQLSCLKFGLQPRESGKLNCSLFGAPEHLSQLSLF